MNQSVWVLAEHDQKGPRPVTFELISEARKLADRFDAEVCVCVLGDQIANEILSSLAGYGVQKVCLIENPALGRYDLGLYTQVLTSLLSTYQPSVVFIGHTASGSELAPRVAARNQLPCITQAKRIIGSRDRLTVTKSVSNEFLYAAIEPQSGRSLVLTISPGETDIIRYSEQDAPEVIRHQLTLTKDPASIKFRRFLKGDPRKITIEEADKIIAIGRGAGKELLAELQLLADMIGASIAGSRAAVDDGIIPYERQIGLSGKSVAPKLLVACGISGAHQFTAGMENSESVIAVNIDESARIFDFANLRIHGDLHDVLPAIIGRLRERVADAAHS